MDLPQTYVAYVCARVRRAPRTSEALLKQSSIERQLTVIRLAARQRRLQLVGLRADATTTPDTRFLDRPAFLDAVAVAKDKGAVLLIEDLGMIVRHLEPAEAAKAAITIATLDVQVVEASTQLVLNDCDQKLLLARVTLAAAATQQRAKRIRAGVTKPRAQTDGRAASRQAAAFRKVQALHNAKRLLSTVREIDAERTTDAPLNANALARSLNERGVAAPRGGLWTHGSASRLLTACRRLKTYGRG